MTSGSMLDFPTDVRCPDCHRWAAQHGDLDLCPKTENEILRVKLTQLQHTVNYLFSLRGKNSSLDEQIM